MGVVLRQRERPLKKARKSEFILPLRQPGVLLEKMPRLSNFFHPRDPELGSEAYCRQAQRAEIESALRLILATEDGLAGDEAVLDFLAFALQRKIDVNQIWIAETGSRIVWALLPIASPGRTMLLFTPSRIPNATPIQSARQLTERVCSHWSDQGMHMAQFLLDPKERSVQELYVSCGFEVLAELIYLQRAVREAPAAAFPAEFELTTYSPQTHAAFAQAILKSYQGSLDCPLLNGRRNIEDVIGGHKAVGGFDPSQWYLAGERGQPLAVLILSPAQHSDSVELVYLGVAPEARKRGLGDAMMRLALSSVLRLERSELSLAVDSKNTPALRLYYRHGMKRVSSRIAMVRDIREAANTVAGVPGSTV